MTGFTTGDDCVWYLKENSASLSETTYTGYSIVSQQDLTNNDYGWNNSGGGGQLVAYYKGNDPGSIWDFVATDETMMEKTVQAIVDLRIPVAKAKGAALVALGVNTEDAISTWNSAVAGVEDGDPTIEDYQTLVGAYIGLQKTVKPVSVNIKHKSHLYEYLGVDANEDIKCLGSADDSTVGQGTRAFTLIPTDEQTGFYLYNPYANMYMKHPTGDNQNARAVANQEDASIYNFDVFATTTNDVTTTDGFGICDINTKASRAYLHSNDQSTSVVRWDFSGQNSVWFVSVVSDDDAAAERLAGANHRAQVVTDKGQRLVALNICADEAVNAWTPIYNKVNGGTASLEEIDQLPVLYANLTKNVKNIPVTLKNVGRADSYMGGDPSTKIVSGKAAAEARTIVFEMAENGEGFHLFNPYTSSYIVHPNNTSAEITLTYNKSQASVYNLDLFQETSNIGFVTTANINYAKYLHDSGSKTIVAWNFGSGDNSSSWEVSLSDATDESIAAEQLTGANHYINLYGNTGKYLRAQNVYPDEMANAWDDISAKAANNNATVDDYKQFVDELYPDLFKRVKQVSVTIMRKNGGNGQNFMAGTPEGGINATATDTEGRRAMTLVPTDNGDGFYIYNEYTSKFIIHPAAADNTNVGTTANKSEASVYKFDIKLNNGDDNYIGLWSTNESTNFLNFNANYGIVRWVLNDPHSAWAISVIDDTQAAREHLNGAIAFLTTPEGMEIGTGLGQYQSNESAAQALAQDENATAEELRAMADNLYVINVPQAGHFYRFHLGNSYMSSELSNNGRFSMIEESNSDNLDNKTVFYFDGTHLVTFPEGLVMGNLDTSNGSLKGEVLASSSAVGNVEFYESPYEIGKYAVYTTNGRYLYHQGSFIDSGTSVDNRDGYKWEISDVTWLPIPHDGGDYISVYSPVALEKSYNRIGKHHSGSINAARLEKLPQTEEYIPANTPLLLEYKSEAGMSNGCVFLQILYPEYEDTVLFDGEEESTESDLNGHYLAQPKDDSKKYFTVNGTNFVEHSGEYVPGFQAHLAVNADDAKESYAISEKTVTAIAEITAGDKAGEIFDLQGRRLAAPVHGVNIINGKKVLVK